MLIFFTYLYAPTVLGVRIAPHKTILVPTAHDEPAIRLEIYKELFSLPAGMAYNTDVERRFLTTHFSIRAVEEETVGCGVDLPQSQPHAREAPAPDRDASADDADATAAEDEAAPDDLSPTFRPHLAHRGAIFRRRHRLHGPFALYGGRIDPGKGCEELIEYFSTYVQEAGDASLVLMGVKLMPLPEEPFIRFAGRLSDQERLQALEAATVVVVPSPTRACRCSRSSRSRSARRCSPTPAARCWSIIASSSNAGLFYADRDEFTECLKLLVADQRLRAAMGRNGRHYVRQNYRWDVILGKYERMFTRLRQQPARRA